MSLLTGCVQSAAAPHFNAATRRVFDALGISLTETPAARCCGAVAFHLDAADEARAHVRRNIDAWIADLDAGAEAIIVNASGCAAFVRDYPDVLCGDPAYADKARRVAEAVRDPIEILRQAEPRAARTPAHPRIAVHDPCTLRNGPRLDGAVAALLAEPAGVPTAAGRRHAPVLRLGRRLFPAAAALRATPAGRQARSAERRHAGSHLHRQHRLLDAPRRRLGPMPGPPRHWIEAVDDVL